MAAAGTGKPSSPETTPNERAAKRMALHRAVYRGGATESSYFVAPAWALSGRSAVPPMGGCFFGISRVRLTQADRHTLREAPLVICLDDLIALGDVGISV